MVCWVAAAKVVVCELPCCFLSVPFCLFVGVRLSPYQSFFGEGERCQRLVSGVAVVEQRREMGLRRAPLCSSPRETDVVRVLVDVVLPRC